MEAGLRWLFCGVLVWAFAWTAAQFYLPGRGFTYLLNFGQRQDWRFLPELRAAAPFETADSLGYDSQFYAQIAMHPDLGDPDLRKAVDDLPYRAHRILFCLTAWALAGGRPALALNVYAVQNLACWFLLALLLFRWLPPKTWGGCARWAAVLFSFGLATSIRNALPEGPSLLLIAAALALVESRRGWPASLLLGIAGLGKEVNVLAGAALPPPGRGARFRVWSAYLGRVALVLLPLAAWVLGLSLWLGRSGATGAGNFALPFAGLGGKALQIAREWRAVTERRALFPLYDLAALAGLAVQFLFFALRPRWRDPWWRLGGVYALLLVFLGPAVWAGYPGAAVRVLLPMDLAFNVLVPRGKAWPLLLIAGNLGILGTPDILRPPGRESFAVRGPAALRLERGRPAVLAVYSANWEPPEKSRLEFWRWCVGSGTVAIRNLHPRPIAADLSFRLRADDPRTVTVTLGRKVVWSGPLRPGRPSPVDLRGVRLDPGDTVLGFRSDRPPSVAGDALAPRSFSLRNLEIELKE